jgi:hypothetical protein
MTFRVIHKIETNKPTETKKNYIDSRSSRNTRELELEAENNKCCVIL